MPPYDPTDIVGTVLLTAVNETSSGLTLAALSGTPPFLQDILDENTVGLVSEFVASTDSTRAAVARAFRDPQGKTLFELVSIEGADRRTRSSIWNRSDWQALLGWESDGNHVLVGPFFDESMIPGDRPDKVIRLDILDGSQDIVSPAFPYSGAALFDYWRDIGTSVVFDPSLSYVAILDGEQSLVVWDATNSVALGTFHSSGVFSDLPRPVWSREGSNVVITIDNQADSTLSSTREYRFVSIDIGGETTTSPILGNDANIDPTSLRLSPNGRMLSFFVESSNSAQAQLILWDIAANAITQTCLTGRMSPPVWAPDSRHFLISADSQSTSASESGDSGRTVMVVDLDGKSVAVLDVGEFDPHVWLR